MLLFIVSRDGPDYAQARVGDLPHAVKELQEHKEAREKFYLHRLLVAVHAQLGLTEGQVDEHCVNEGTREAVPITWS